MNDMMITNITCPSCGSVSLKHVKRERDIKVPYSEQHSVTLDEYTCLDCGFSGDITGKNDSILEHAIGEANHEALRNIIDHLTSRAISMAAMERALELPQRTLTKWKNQIASPSSAGFALMKMIRTFPWLLEVAEHQYEPVISQRIFINHAIESLLSAVAVYQGVTVKEMGSVRAGTATICYVRFETNQRATTCSSPSTMIANSNNAEIVQKISLQEA